jgi:hypothetical protein
MQFHLGRLFDHLHLRVSDVAASKRFYPVVRGDPHPIPIPAFPLAGGRRAGLAAVTRPMVCIAPPDRGPGAGFEALTKQAPGFAGGC